MPIVKRVSVAPYTLPLKSPLMWGHGHIMRQMEHVLVQVELSDGAVGIAEANPRPTIYGETAESVESVIRRHIAPEIEGQPIETTGDIDVATSRYALLKNNNSARAAVDMALWMALAQSLGITPAELLGVEQEKVRVSYILGTGDLNTLMREVTYVYNRGVRVLKVKVGKDFNREHGLIRDIKQAYPEMDCYIDANQSYTAADAVERLAAFAELGVMYCEEPLPVHLVEERIYVAERSAMPLVADDSTITLLDLEREVALDSFDVLNIKPPRNGFTEGKKMLAMAKMNQKRVMMGSQASSVLGCAYTVLFSAVAGVNEPCEGTFFLKVDDEAELPIHHGYIDTAYVNQAVQDGLYGNARARFRYKRQIYWNSPDIERILEAEAGEEASKIAGKIAFQMRNLISAMATSATYLDGLVKNASENALQTAVETTEVMGHASRRALRLIGQIEDSILIDAGEYMIDPVGTHPVDTLLAQTIAQVKKENVAEPVRIHAEVEPDLPEIPLSVRLVTMLQLVIEHLAEASSEDREVSITAKLSKNPHYVLITVSNPGDVFPSGVSARQRGIDKHYWRANNKLDLFIAYHIVEASGGEIRLGSEEGSPTRAYITLPIFEPSSAVG